MNETRFRPSPAARPRRPARRPAFTLIELLIVVAIIAILAAIAIPNFINAQVRAKVSHVLSDLRAMRTAVESYGVDNNRVARMSWGCVWDDYAEYHGQRQDVYGTMVGGPSRNASNQPSVKGLGGGVTSPIAYITTLPLDPFDEGRYSYAHWLLYTYFEVDSMRDVINSGMSCPVTFMPGYIWFVGQPSAPNMLQHSHGKYILWSIGPQGEAGVQAPGRPFWRLYDPTNGTVSAGSIYVSQKYMDQREVAF